MENITAEDNGTVLARASLWKGKSEIFGKKTGYIGHFAAKNIEAGLFLLNGIREKAAEYGFEYITGPLDGNTWQKYRFVVENNENPFFMEPHNPLEWPEIFMSSGYEVIAEYYSLKVTEPEKKNRVSEKIKKINFYSDLEIKAVDKENFDKYINEIYDISIKAFRNNFLYSEISRDEFLSSYLKIKNLIDCDLVFIAYKAGVPAGFVFGIPDYNEGADGHRIKTAILKTLAVNPEYHNFGLGSVLTEEFHKAAAAKGYENVIHALIYKDNMSKKISEKYGEIMRKYHLYGMGI